MIFKTNRVIKSRESNTPGELRGCLTLCFFPQVLLRIPSVNQDLKVRS